MNKSPAFQFYPDEFLGGTMTMSHEERGFYILLLCLQWTQFGITESDFERLGKGMAEPSLNHVKAKFKKCPDGLLKQHRLEKVRENLEAFRKNRSESGKSGALSRWHSHSTANQQPLANDSSLSPTPSLKIKKKPSIEEVKLCCAKSGIQDSDAIWFWNKCEGNGWTNGGKPIKSWQHTLASWKAAGYLPSQKSSGFQPKQKHTSKMTDLEILREAI